MAGSPDRYTSLQIYSNTQRRFNGQSGDGINVRPIHPHDLIQFMDLGVWEDQKLLTAEEEVYHAKRYRLGRQVQAKMKMGLFETDEQKTEATESIVKGIESREQMIGRNLRLVISIAHKYQGHGVPMLDLMQEGNLGLLKAVDKFDESRGYRFSTYAVWWIKQSIQRAVFEQGRSVRVPEHILYLLSRVRRTSYRILLNTGREPGIGEIAHVLGIDENKIRDAYKSVQVPVSIDAPITEDGATLFEILPGNENTEENAMVSEKKQKVRAMLDKLPENLRRVIQLRHGILDNRSRTLAETGNELGITREWVRQLEMRAFEKLREFSRDAGFEEYLE